jgi:putative hydrolase of the HAD superfamily
LKAAKLYNMSTDLIRTIIFDADGVLINGEKFSAVLVHDYKIDSEKVHEFFTTKFQECLVGKADLKQSITPYLASFGWTGTVDDLLQYWFKAEHSLNETLLQYVRQLRESGVQVVLATNQEKYRTQYMLDHMGFGTAFDKIYSSAHLGLKKPAVEFFAKIVEELGVGKQEVLFWDDDQNNVEGARTYGIHAEYYSNYENFMQVMQSKYEVTVAKT